MLPISETFASRFTRQFDILLADNGPLRQRVYQVRHRVFCQELGFEMQNDGELETNEYDDHSLQLLVRDRIANTDIACMRIVEPLKRGGGLPFESFGLGYIDRKLFDWKQLEGARCCELSRLAVLENIRRQSNSGVGVVNIEQASIARDIKAFIPISLLHAAFALIFASDYEWIFMGAEPRLQRFLARYGFNFRQISPLFDYYGQRAVFVLNRNELLADMHKWKSDWLDLYQDIDNKLIGSDKNIAVAHAS